MASPRDQSMQVVKDASDARTDRRMQEVVELRHQLPFPHQDAFVVRDRRASDRLQRADAFSFIAQTADSTQCGGRQGEWSPFGRKPVAEVARVGSRPGRL